MDRERFSPEKIIVQFREAEVIEAKGLAQIGVAKKLGICERTLIHWRKEYYEKIYQKILTIKINRWTVP